MAQPTRLRAFVASYASRNIAVIIYVELYGGIYGRAWCAEVDGKVRGDKDRTMKMPFNATSTLLAEEQHL